ncbi:PREDICTED: myeloblastin-like [Ceratosolen solmsi marchali]|uniref:Myeloblastin-like n=1 Tax=Ceratosolen solmsi marchali TaxID=326594 RepID=A0AAJ6VNJ6_9HYME|nr:PREDICTED: myeloblastin-like [Ceratosolen solmsi marchali]
MFNYSMQLKVYSILASFLIFLKDLDNAAANPMFGENVRLANPGEFPFVASVKRINPSNPLSEYDHLCTGVLISNRDVLTVEHCLQPLSAFYIEISVGSHNIREGIKYPIDWWMSYSTWTTFRHIAPRYNKNDISIIRVSLL